MLVTKPNVTGVDIPIQKLQEYLYNKLICIWDGDYGSYGRVYRNQTKDGYTPERYVGKNEYNDTYQDDGLAASSFFGLGENTKVDKSNWTADVFMVFMVDLSKIKPGTTRNDEEARLDVEKIVDQKPYGFTVSGIVLGIDNVFKEYTGYKKIDGIKYRDTHPLHCFRINFKLLYNIYDCK